MREIDREPADIDPRRFYEKYVLRRRPCIITSIPAEEFDSLPVQSNESRRSVLDQWMALGLLGDEIVRVEQKSERTNSFGTADYPKTKMSVRSLVAGLKGEYRGSWYMTTQYDDESNDSKLQEAPKASKTPMPPTPPATPKNRKRKQQPTHDQTKDHRARKRQRLIDPPTPGKTPMAHQDPAMERRVRQLWPAPLSGRLCHQLPSCPSLMGHLVPHQINLWLGSTHKGQSTSSGLHHDYHDNLYMQLDGRKRFLLFAPSDLPFLYVQGVVYQIHKNGLVTYMQLPYNQLTYHASCSTHAAELKEVDEARFIRSDGADRREVAKWRYEHAKHQLEQMAQKLERDRQRQGRQWKGKANMSEFQRMAEIVQQRLEEFEELLADGDNLLEQCDKDEVGDMSDLSESSNEAGLLDDFTDDQDSDEDSLNEGDNESWESVDSDGAHELTLAESDDGQFNASGLEGEEEESDAEDDDECVQMLLGGNLDEFNDQKLHEELEKKMFNGPSLQLLDGNPDDLIPLNDADSDAGSECSSVNFVEMIEDMVDEVGTADDSDEEFVILSSDESSNESEFEDQVLEDVESNADSLDVDWNAPDAFDELNTDNGEEQSEPPSFSYIPVSVLHKFIQDPKSVSGTPFEQMLKTTPFVVDLEPGEILYLPASWFHEVSSFGLGKDGMHMALNYWFHPPSMDGTFERPYEDDYWRCQYEETMNYLQQRKN